MDAEMSIPNRIPQIPSQAGPFVDWACVENMGSLPYPALGQKGKDMFRSVGNSTDRGSRNVYPLCDVSLILMEAFRFLVEGLHSGLTNGVSMLPLNSGNAKKIFDNTNDLGLEVRQIRIAKKFHKSFDVVNFGGGPNDLRLAEIVVGLRVRKVNAPKSRYHSAEFFTDSEKNGSVVITLGNARLGIKVNHNSTVLSRALCPVDAKCSFRHKEASKLSGPKRINRIPRYIQNHSQLTSYSYMNSIAHHTVDKQQECKDLADELVAGVGTYPIGDGPTASVFKSFWKLPIADCEIYEDGNITIDSSDDAKGGVFCQSGIVLVQGRVPWQETRREPDLGGGADSIWHYDEYIYGERLGAGSTSVFVQEVYSDALAPTA